MPLTDDQLARRRAGQCEFSGCPRPAGWVVTRGTDRKKPLRADEQPPESWRYCGPHSQVDLKQFDVARIKETA